MRHRARGRAPAGLGLCLLLALGLGACGSGGSDEKPKTAGLPGEGKPPVRLATKNFTEEFVLGQLYKQALEAKGYRIVLKNNVGSSEIVDRALVRGAIDMYPEYTGVIVNELAHQTNRPKTAEETYDRAKAFEEQRGFTVLAMSPGFDADAHVVRTPYARRYGLKSSADLKKLKSFRYGAAPENMTRFEGAVGMREVYGLHNFRFVALPIDKRYDALDRGQIDVAAGFTTEPELVDTSRYVVLTDPKDIFGFQNIVPVVNKKVLATEGPAFASTIDAVSAKLTNRALQRMNADVAVKKRSAAAVAAEFLEANGLR